MLKRLLFSLTILLFTSTCFAQDTIEIKRKVTGDITEIYKAVSNDVSTRQGPFRALYKKKVPIASGMYKNDKKVGLWTFTDRNGTVLQNYDYTNNRLLYEAPEDTSSKLRYFADKIITEKDTVTKPIKAGGRYYGYLPYLTLFSLPDGYKDIDREAVMATVELLVSPGGRLADYKVNLIARGLNQPFKTVNMNIKLPDPADVVFIPARLNGEPIACRITIKCIVNSRGHLDFE